MDQSPWRQENVGKEGQRLITIQQPRGDRPWHYFREPHPCPQVKLKQISPRTEEEKTEHSVAAERRRMRLVYADTIKDLLANWAIQYGEWLGAGRAAGAPLCPGPHWAEGGEAFPWDVYPLVASGLAGPLASRPPSGKRECLLPSSQQPEENALLATKCVWVSRT